MKVFTLPDLGEGLPDAEIHEWHVKEGDTVKVDQLLVSMETAKAVVDVPSPYDGVIGKLHGKSGDVITVGSPLAEFITDAGATIETPKANKCDAATVAGEIEVGNTVLVENAQGVQIQDQHATHPQILPALRVLAEKLGIRLQDIPSSGQLGHISLDDFANFIKTKFSVKTASSHSAPAVVGNFQKLKGVRKAMANSMALSHAHVAAVTIVDDADISAWPKGTDITCRLLRAIIKACQAEPVLNAWFDGENLAIDIKKEINIGIAVDTPDGLFVPVIQHAEQCSPEQLRETINRFKTQAQDRSLPSKDLKDPTISLSNFGTFAGRYASPVVVPPMVAIIGAGRLKEQVILVDGKVENHRIMPLSLSFDHRAATGGEASRFLKAMIDDLQLVD